MFKSIPKMWGGLLQTETFVHQSLQAWAVDQVVGEFFVREHAKAARRALAAISAASSTVRSGSWLMTDITMFIMTCRRRILRASSSFALVFSAFIGRYVTSRRVLDYRRLGPLHLHYCPRGFRRICGAYFDVGSTSPVAPRLALCHLAARCKLPIGLRLLYPGKTGNAVTAVIC